MLSGVFLVSVSSILVWIGTLNTQTHSIQKESMSMDDAKLFPVIGSFVLLSLFFALRYLPKSIINTLFRALFTVTGTFTVYKILKVIYHQFRPVQQEKVKEEKVNKDVPEKEATDKNQKETTEKPVNEGASTSAAGKEDAVETAQPAQAAVSGTWAGFKNEVYDSIVEIKACANVYLNEFRKPQFAGMFAVSCLINAWYFKTKNVNSSNILASAFAIMGIREIKPDSTKTVLVLLSLLFLYDIFWVFFTPVMIGVAKGLDIPIKIVYPFTRKVASMIGLGDIVIPGLFLSLARDFAHKFSAPLVFTFGFIGYILALIVTFAIVFIFKAGQPALLYICPLIVAGSLVGCAVHKKTKEFIDYKAE
ncbi:minor histocompatibility antigen H13 [Nematocida sp. ERTm5]|nr:minor histocompatibility antigen H13 [Nematocida sp. ERTm5]